MPAALRLHRRQAPGHGAKEILAFNKLVNDGKSPADVTKAAGQCFKFAAP